MDEKQKAELLGAAKQMPPAAISQLKKILTENFKEENIPYDESHLKAALSICHLINPSLPPLYSGFVSSTILILMCLVDEEEKGLIRSPIQKP